MVAIIDRAGGKSNELHVPRQHSTPPLLSSFSCSPPRPCYHFAVPDPIENVLARDPRYRVEAYLFVHDAIEFTQARFTPRRHVTGRELLDGIRELALERYGRMAKAVLNSWGVRTTDDFGAVVFNLVDSGLMSRTEEDRIEDFHSVYDFDEAFVQSYELGAGRKESD